MRSDSFFSMLVLAALACAPGCGDDKGDTSDSAATTGPMTTTTPGTTTGSSTDQTTADSDVTGAPTTGTSTTASSDVTGAPTTGATTGGGGEFNFCQESCSQDADCTIMGADAGYACQGGSCVSGEPFTCQSNDECDALFSGWATSCASQMDCPGQVCISLEGEGRCAFAPGNGLTCEGLMMEELMVTTIEGMPATVCGKTGAVCEDGVCRNPCKSDAQCFPQAGYPHCNVDTGGCECVTDNDCAVIGNPAFSRCNAGVCGCGADADCVGGTNVDKCYDGFCGCSSDAACTQKVFDGTMLGWG